MIALGSDHAGYELKEKIKRHFDKTGVAYEDFGCECADPVDYPIYSAKVSRAVANGKFRLGIICCGTGIGMSIAANKVDGIRAACCSDEFTAEMTRAHNDANVLCLGARVISEETALKLVDIFLNTKPSDEERHVRRRKLLSDIEQGIL